MNERTERKIRTLFERYVANFALYSPAFPEQFLCPLCLRGFPREAIPWGHLSLAHIVPKAYGGKVCTLLCKRCNNTLGSEIEGQADKRKKLIVALQGKSKKAARLHVTIQSHEGDIATLPAYVRGDANNRVLELRFEDTASDPDAFNRSLKTTQLGLAQDGPGIGISFEEPGHYRGEIADLVDYSIAYHALFAVMGYEFAFSELGLKVRDILLTPSKYSHLESWYGYAREDEWAATEPGKPVVLNGILGVTMPEIAPMPSRRVLFVGPLCGSLDPALFENENKQRRVSGLTCNIDASNLPLLPLSRGIYHRAFYGRNFRLETTIHDEGTQA